MCTLPTSISNKSKTGIHGSCSKAVMAVVRWFDKWAQTVPKSSGQRRFLSPFLLQHLWQPGFYVDIKKMDLIHVPMAILSIKSIIVITIVVIVVSLCSFLLLLLYHPPLPPVIGLFIFAIIASLSNHSSPPQRRFFFFCCDKCDTLTSGHVETALWYSPSQRS